MSNNTQRARAGEEGSPLLVRIVLFGIIGLMFAVYFADVFTR